MAKTRKAGKKRKTVARRKTRGLGSLDSRVSQAVAQLKQTFGVVKVVGSVKNGKLDLESDFKDGIRFVALNAPFKTKARVEA